MAIRYWVGADGNWSDTAHWSTTSGGAGGASVPGAADTATFNANSNTGTTAWTVTVDAVTTITSLSVNGVDAVMTLASAGNLTVTSTTGISSNATATNGLTISGNASLAAVTFGPGTLNLNGSSVTMTSLATNVGTKNFTFGTGGVVNLTGNAGTIWNASGAAFTITDLGTINCTYSGATGTRTINNAPGSGGGPNVSFNITAGTDTVTFTASNSCYDLDFTGFSGTWTNVAMSIYGKLTTSTGMTVGAGTNLITFAATSGTNDLTGNGKTWNFPVTFNGVGGTWRLIDAVTIGATRTTTLTNGTLNLNDNKLSTGLFATATGTKTLAFGTTGSIDLTATTSVTVWSVSAANFTITGTSLVTLVGGGTGITSTFGAGALNETNAINFVINAATTDTTVTFTANNTLKNLTITKGTFTSIALTIYGNYSVAASNATISSGANALTFAATSGTKTITTNGVTIDVPITFSGIGGTWQLVDNLTVGATRTTTLTNGTLSLNDKKLSTGLFNSSTTTTRVIAFATTGSIALTNTTTTTVWNCTTATNLSVTGTPLVSYVGGSTTSTATITTGTLSEANSISFTILPVSSAAIVSFTAGSVIRNLTLTDGVLASTAITVYGNFTHGPTVLGVYSPTVTGGTGTITFAATSGTKTITSNGNLIDRPITFDGVGGTWQVVDTFSTQITNRLTTLTNGILDLNNQIWSTGSFSSSNSNARTLAFGTSGQLNIMSPSTGTVWTTTTTTNFSITGTSYVNFTGGGAATTSTFDAGQLSESNAINFTINPFDPSSIITFTASNTVKNLTLSNGVFSDVAITIYGNLSTAASGLTLTGTNTLTFAATSGTKTITSNGFTIDRPITFNGVGGTWQLVDNVTIGSTRTSTITAGTLDLNTKVLTTGIFASSGAGTKVIIFGTSRIDLSGNATTILNFATATNLSVTGTPYFKSTYTGATGTRTFNTTGLTETQANSFGNVATSGSSGIVLGVTATDIIALTGGFGNVDLTGFTNTLSNTARTIYGNFTLPVSGGTFTAGTIATTFGATSGTKSITSNGRTADFAITFDGVGGTWQLVDNFTVGSGKITTITSGTLNLNTKVLSTGAFACSGTNSKTVSFGTSRIDLTGNSLTILDFSSVTNLTLTGTPYFNSTYSGPTGTRTFNTTGLNETQANSYGNVATSGSSGIVLGTTATDTIALTGSFGDVDLTGFTNTLSSTTRTIYGNLTFPASGGAFTSGSATTTFGATSGIKTITSNGRLANMSATFDGVGGTWQLIDDFSLSANTFTTTLTNGTLDLNGKNLSTGLFSSSNSNIRTIAFGSTGNINLQVSSVSTAWNTSTPTNLSITGTPQVTLTGGGVSTLKTVNTGAMSEANSISFTANFSTTGSQLGFAAGSVVRNLTVTFGTLAASAVTIYGNFSVAATNTTITAGTALFTFAATSGTKTITTNGITIDRPITFDGVGGTWQLVDALTVGATRTTTLTNGIFDANNKNFSTGLFASNNSNIRTLTMGSGTWTLSGTGTVWDLGTTTNLTFNKNTANITLSDTSTTARTFAGGSLTYNNLAIGGTTGSSTLTITGSNTFGTLSSSKTVAHTITFTAGTTTTVSGWTVEGTLGNVVTINSSSAGTPANLVISPTAIVPGLDYLSIQDSAASPRNVWFAGSHSTDVSGNSNWLFADYSPGRFFALF